MKNDHFAHHCDQRHLVRLTAGPEALMDCHHLGVVEGRRKGGLIKYIARSVPATRDVPVGQSAEFDHPGHARSGGDPTDAPGHTENRCEDGKRPVQGVRLVDQGRDHGLQSVDQ